MFVIFSVILTSFLRDIFCYVDECSLVIFSAMLTSVPSRYFLLYRRVFLRDIFCYINECSFEIFSVILTSVPS